MFPATGGLLLTGVIACGYLANAIFRGLLFWIGADEAPTYEVRASDPALLPVYTVLVPLYREANIISQLTASLRRLDYPAANLDCKLVVEEDDQETCDAARAAAADGFFEVVAVPRGEPRTKPRACNYALQFARGELLVIYDAEDQPEPDQLKKALHAFSTGPRELACVQARLNFFNARECWITRMFTLDYSLWFDFLLPGLDRLHIPMPLGGTSNHFKVDALRAIHGWDPFNVTEDADLGIRLSRLGLRVQTLDSTTYEEATNAAGNWLRQRTRWLKGYMQTWLVHMRDPRQLVRNSGWAGFFGFQMFVGGTVLSALLNPFLWLIFIASFFVDLPVVGFSDAMRSISGFGLLIGNALFAYLAMLGPYRRGWLDLSPYALLVPLYWLLISLAAYRALWQLMRNPWHWEKTPHGVSRMKSAGLVS
jgi:glycosyltransferase XagB